MSAKTKRIVVILPLQEKKLQEAAQAVQAGILNAFRQEQQNIEISVVETDETPQQLLEAFQKAQNEADIVIGPLTRASVKEVMSHAAIKRPTIALSLPDTKSKLLPQHMLAIGLSVEEEARQVAGWAHASSGGEEDTARFAFVVNTFASWQQRAGKAFTAEWEQLGGNTAQIQIPEGSGDVLTDSIDQLSELIRSEKPHIVFAALNAEQSMRLYAKIGAQVPVYGTSQSNPQGLNKNILQQLRVDHSSNEAGLWFIDIPWQLQPDHPAVITYRAERLSQDARFMQDDDLQRLYALGIDAYRIAYRIANAPMQSAQPADASFEIDGVTGKLIVQLAAKSTRFVRTEEPAVFRSHKVMPIHEAD